MCLFLQDKPHKCTLCSKSFPTPGDLKSHMYVHNGSWPYKCDVCNRGFSKHTNLKNHLLLHTGEYAYLGGGSRGGGEHSSLVECSSLKPKVQGSKTSPRRVSLFFTLCYALCYLKNISVSISLHVFIASR